LFIVCCLLISLLFFIPLLLILFSSTSNQNSLLLLDSSKTTVAVQLASVETLVLGIFGCNLLGSRVWVSTYGSVCLGVKLLNVIGTNLRLDVTREFALESGSVVVLELSHVISDVCTKNVFAEDISLELLALSVVTNITGDDVWDINTTINSTLEGGEHS